MLQEKVVHNFSELQDKSIDDVIEQCKAHFFAKCLELVDIYRKHTEDLFSLKTYRIFNSTFGKKILYQDKSIEYESLETNIQEGFDNFLKRFSNCCEGACVPTVQEENARAILLQEIPQKDTLTLDETVIDIENSYPRWTELFGLGEFPFLNITITRIGNKRYYFYTICR